MACWNWAGERGDGDFRQFCERLEAPEGGFAADDVFSGVQGFGRFDVGAAAVLYRQQEGMCEGFDGGQVFVRQDSKSSSSRERFKVLQRVAA